MDNQKRSEITLFIAWAVALTATLGSLFFSEVMNFPPCELCWYQRVFMYPMSIILLIGITKKDYGIAMYSLPVALVGWIIAGYHTLLQYIPALKENVIGCGAIPCDTDYLDWFNGIVTIPLLSFTAYSIIIGCSIFLIKLNKKSS